MLPAMAEPMEVRPEEFDEVVRDSEVPVLVDFWAAWCGPCRKAAPHVAQVARDLAGRAVGLKVDTEQFPELASRYNVQGIPNFAEFARGSLQLQQAGLVEANTMKVGLPEQRSEDDRSQRSALIMARESKRDFRAWSPEAIQRF